ncbi:MAG: Peroxyureidoacrylate/ureidoacrylate amidohydrolase RutB [Syntrophorhabdus sp. PtaB.Bin047]|jgi:nicotinamidase/pyrazinamidase|nr:MAG: Peroxyureidoacrylate/ureidoacrylate amidohydrolase RutB [Syntrophorhabdus sp. PtaB.Bin047]
MPEKWAVIVIDLQGDFTEWKQGSLAVPGSDEGYVRAVENATRQLKELGILVLGTQDWHPPDHVSFATSHPGKRPFETVVVDGKAQDLWPSHCVQGTGNARVVIDNNLFLAVVKKAEDPMTESYSGFQSGGELDAVLRANGIGRVIVYGLATDYCVKATSLDLAAAGYLVVVVENLCRSVSPDTAAAAVDEMRREGVRVVDTVEEVIEEIRRNRG